MAEVARYSVAGSAREAAAALVGIIRRLSVASSVEEIMEVVTPAARTLLGADGVTFVLREGDNCHYADEDAISPLWKGKRFPMSACISGWCMLERKPAAIGDIYLDPRIPHDAYRPTFVRSLAMVPVRQDDPIAALGAYWRETRTISPRELDLLQAIANAAALATANVELKQEADRLEKVQDELSHRIKNILSLVEALARQTSRRAATTDDFTTAFIGRIRALARAQQVVQGPKSGVVDLRSIISDQVLLEGDDRRVLLEGETVELSGGNAFDLSLLLHELGTNARKYGSLSSDRGTVMISWRRDAADGCPALDLVWTERDGPPVVKPEREGFGGTLLRHSFAEGGGQAEIEFAPAGVICRMRIPFDGGRTSPPPAAAVNDAEGERTAEGDRAVAAAAHILQPSPSAGGEAAHGSQLVESLPPHVAQAVQVHSTPRFFGAGKVLRKSDSASEAVYLVRSGLFSILGNLDGHAQVEVALVGREGLIGLTAALASPGDVREVVAASPSEVDEIEAGTFNSLLGEYPELREAVLAYASRRLDESTRLAACNAKHRLEGRLARWLCVAFDRLGESQIDVTHRDLAMLLGVRRASVTEGLHMLEGAGAIYSRRGSVILRDRAKLEGLSCGCHRPVSARGD